MIKSALADFTATLDEMNQVAEALSELPELPGRDKHVARIEFARAQVAMVQTVAVQLTMAFSGIRRGTKIKLPQAAEDTALYALKGGTALLAAVTYAARQFIHAQQNPDAPPLIHGIVTGANWAGLGQALGVIEGMRK